MDDSINVNSRFSKPPLYTDRCQDFYETQDHIVNILLLENTITSFGDNDSLKKQLFRA